MPRKSTPKVAEPVAPPVAPVTSVTTNGLPPVGATPQPSSMPQPVGGIIGEEP